MPALAGANLIYGLGMIESGMTFDFGQLVMDDEFAGMIKQCVRGIRVDDEALAVDVIDDIGPFGDFLSHDHTMAHMRETVAACLHRPSRPGGLERERFADDPGPRSRQGAQDPRDTRAGPAAGRRRRGARGDHPQRRARARRRVTPPRRRGERQGLDLGVITAVLGARKGIEAVRTIAEQLDAEAPGLKRL